MLCADAAGELFFIISSLTVEEWSIYARQNILETKCIEDIAWIVKVNMRLDNHSGSINVMKGLLIDSKVDNNETYMGIYDSSWSCGDEGVE